MAAGCINSTLPAEVLERIFKLLPNRDLKVVVGNIHEMKQKRSSQKNVQVRVCRRWRDVGEQPGLWSWVVIDVHLGNLARFELISCISNTRKRTWVWFLLCVYLILYLCIIKLFGKGACRAQQQTAPIHERSPPSSCLRGTP